MRAADRTRYAHARFVRGVPLSHRGEAGQLGHVEVLREPADTALRNLKELLAVGTWDGLVGLGAGRVVLEAGEAEGVDAREQTRVLVDVAAEQAFAEMAERGEGGGGGAR